jgi:uncharacterized protein (DUF1684 family)
MAFGGTWMFHTERCWPNPDWRVGISRQDDPDAATIDNDNTVIGTSVADCCAKLLARAEAEVAHRRDILEAIRASVRAAVEAAS